MDCFLKKGKVNYKFHISHIFLTPSLALRYLFLLVQQILIIIIINYFHFIFAFTTIVIAITISSDQIFLLYRHNQNLLHLIILLKDMICLFN